LEESYKYRRYNFVIFAIGVADLYRARLTTC